MNFFTFLSAGKPNEIGYRVERDPGFDYRFRGACRWAKFFPTYGDGCIQHGLETTFAREMLPDFLGSLANALASTSPDRRAEMLGLVDRHWPRRQNDEGLIEFALSLKPHASKRMYYNLRERKTSFAASKYHDKRWEAIDPGADHVDGSIVSTARLLNVGSCYDDLHAIQAYREIEEVCLQKGGYGTFDVWNHFGLTTSVVGRLSWAEVAWTAVDGFVTGHRATVEAMRQSAAWKQNAIEERAKAKPA